MNTRCLATLNRVNLSRFSRVKNRFVPLLTLGTVSRQLAQAATEQDITVKIERGKLHVQGTSEDWHQLGFSRTTARRLNGYISELRIAFSSTPNEIRGFLRALMKRPVHELANHKVAAENSSGHVFDFINYNFRKDLYYRLAERHFEAPDFGLAYGEFGCGCGALLGTPLGALAGLALWDADFAGFFASMAAGVFAGSIGTFLLAGTLAAAGSSIRSVARATYGTYSMLRFSGAYQTCLKAANGYELSSREDRRLQRLLKKLEGDHLQQVIEDAIRFSPKIPARKIKQPPTLPTRRSHQQTRPPAVIQPVVVPTPRIETPRPAKLIAYPGVLQYPDRISGKPSLPDPQDFIVNPRPITTEMLMAYALHPDDMAIIIEAEKALIQFVKRGSHLEVHSLGSTGKGSFLPNNFDFDLMYFGYYPSDLIANVHDQANIARLEAALANFVETFYSTKNFRIVTSSKEPKWRHARKVLSLEIEDRKHHLADINFIPTTYPQNTASLNYYQRWQSSLMQFTPAQQEILLRNIRMARHIMAEAGLPCDSFYMEQMVLLSRSLLPKYKDDKEPGSFDALLELFNEKGRTGSGHYLDTSLFRFSSRGILVTQSTQLYLRSHDQVLDLARRYHESKS